MRDALPRRSEGVCNARMYLPFTREDAETGWFRACTSKPWSMPVGINEGAPGSIYESKSAISLQIANDGGTREEDRVRTRLDRYMTLGILGEAGLTILLHHKVYYSVNFFSGQALNGRTRGLSL